LIVHKEVHVFVVVIDSVILYVGSWRGANAFGKLCLMAGDRPTLRKARTGEAAAYRLALCNGLSLPLASA
jgi:hypothetical protein